MLFFSDDHHYQLVVSQLDFYYCFYYYFYHHDYHRYLLLEFHPRLQILDDIRILLFFRISFLNPHVQLLVLTFESLFFSFEPPSVS